MADVGIGMLFRMLEYKFDRQGKNLLRADRWYPSSKRCPVCGKVNADLKLKDRR
ncbi:MAG: zinc ribbon domain-containing protein [Duodenibacillus sp.]